MPSQRDSKIASGEKKRYTCHCCEKDYTDVAANFYMVHSKLTRGDSEYSVICKACVDAEYKRAVDIYNDRKTATKYVCGLLGVYFDNGILESLPRSNSGLSSYLSKLYNVADKNLTFLDSVEDDVLDEESTPKSDYVVTADDIDRFGSTWEPDEHRAMHRMYEKMSAKHELTYSEELDLIAACKSLALAERALRNGDSSNYIKLNDMYSKTVDRFQERFKKQAEANENDSSTLLGEKIRMIENYTPAEYYKDQSLFSEGKEYIERFILRPLRNIANGTNEEDSEYRVE